MRKKEDKTWTAQFAIVIVERGDLHTLDRRIYPDPGVWIFRLFRTFYFIASCLSIILYTREIIIYTPQNIFIT